MNSVHRAPIVPERVRSIGGRLRLPPPHRFLREGFFASLAPDELRLYILLVLAADRNGLSFYHYDSICSLLEIPQEVLHRGRLGHEERLTGERRRKPTFAQLLWTNGWINGAWLTLDSGPIFTASRMVADYELENKQGWEVRVLENAGNSKEFLRNLGRELKLKGKPDYIDLYQMHHIDRESPWEEIWEAMEQLVREGEDSLRRQQQFCWLASGPGARAGQEPPFSRADLRAEASTIWSSGRLSWRCFRPATRMASA